MRVGGAAMRAVGAMSGTSLDGVDAAEVVTDGETIAGFGAVAYRAYAPAERAVLRAALGRWPGEPGVAEAAEVVENVHAEVLEGFRDAELVGFHGQTLAHEPGGRGTHQVGDGALLAEVLGRPVVWDFRAADVGLGGQGAPLAPFFHFAAGRWAGLSGPVAFLNLGGVGNVTWADLSAPAPEAPGALTAFDTGPANAPIDDLCAARGLGARDEGGRLAAAGRVDEGVVEAFLGGVWFARVPPKSLDRGAFAGLLAAVSGLADADAAATLTAAAAGAVARAADHFPAPPAALYVAGGGRHNETLMAMLAAALPFAVAPVEVIGLDGDMFEAQAFAHLAVRVLRGLPTSCPGTTGVAAAVGGGRIARPSPGTASAGTAAAG